MKVKSILSTSCLKNECSENCIFISIVFVSCVALEVIKNGEYNNIKNQQNDSLNWFMQLSEIISLKLLYCFLSMWYSNIAEGASNWLVKWNWAHFGFVFMESETIFRLGNTLVADKDGMSIKLRNFFSLFRMIAWHWYSYCSSGNNI